MNKCPLEIKTHCLGRLPKTESMLPGNFTWKTQTTSKEKKRRLAETSIQFDSGGSQPGGLGKLTNFN